MEELFDYAPEMPEGMPGQWRLEQIQVYNWGTIHGYYSFAVPRRGLLLTGESGSGKSTLLDAISTLLTPDTNSTYNSAAAAGSGGDPARSRYSYVRGAYANDMDSSLGTTTTLYLREKATKSGIALTFGNGEGKLWTGGRVFYLRAGGGKADLESRFFHVPGEFELKDAVNAIRNDSFHKALRTVIKDAGGDVQEKSSAFAAVLRGAIGIQSEKAAILLHRAIATKNVTSLDALMRNYMLDTPKTWEYAEEAVKQFESLRQAHNEVLDAKKQLEHLKPLISLCEQRLAAMRQITTCQRLEDLLDPYHDTVLHRFNREKLEEDRGSLAAVEEQLQQLGERITHINGRKNSLQMELNNNQTAALLETQRTKLDNERERLARQKQALEQMHTALQLLSATPPSTAPELLKLRDRAEKELAAIATRKQELSEELLQLGNDRGQLRGQQDELVAELRSLEQRRSLLPRYLVELREELCEALRLPAGDVRFVGELLNVKDAEWRGALERLLRGYALTLLVPGRHAGAVSEWVNGRRLVDRSGRGVRLVYEKIGEAKAPGLSPARSVLEKLHVVPHAAAGEWLAAQLARRFGDFVYVDDVADLAGHARALTREGLVRDYARHEKDDRRAVNDPKNWVLGSDNSAKIEQLHTELEELRKKLAAAESRLGQVQQQQEQLERGRAALEGLTRVEFDHINTAGTEAAMQEISRRIEELQAADTDLARLRQQLDDVEKELRPLEQRRDATVANKGRLDASVEKLTEKVRAYEQRRDKPEISSEDMQQLQKYCLEGRRAHSREGLRDEVKRGRDALAREQREQQFVRDKCTEAMTTRMAQYCERWKQFAANLVPEVDGVDDFINRHNELQENNLPKFLHRFKELMANETFHNISYIANEVRGAFDKVKQRVKPINESLAQTPYDSSRGHFLKIEVKTCYSREVEEFRRDLAKLSSESLNLESFDEPELEDKYQEMAKLLLRLGSDEAADKRWKQEVLDTRKHVSFVAHVTGKDGELVDVYDSSKGRSGGQAQKLVTFCLAAALRYQLADPGKYEPRFGTILLDEAFDKTDPKFTRDSLEVFRTFGFQLVMATPLKMLQAFEPYVGGVVQAKLSDEHHTHFAVTQYEEG